MKTDIYEASDYAGLRAGDLSFYYGYERIYCSRHDHAGVQDSPSCTHDNNAENDCDNDAEWCFVAKKGDKEIATYTQGDLESLVDNEDSTRAYLLAGIARMIEEKKLSPPQNNTPTGI